MSQSRAWVLNENTMYMFVNHSNIHCRSPPFFILIFTIVTTPGLACFANKPTHCWFKKYYFAVYTWRVVNLFFFMWFFPTIVFLFQWFCWNFRFHCDSIRLDRNMFAVVVGNQVLQPFLCYINNRNKCRWFSQCRTCWRSWDSCFITTRYHTRWRCRWIGCLLLFNSAKMKQAMKQVKAKLVYCLILQHFLEHIDHSDCSYIWVKCLIESSCTGVMFYKLKSTCSVVSTLYLIDVLVAHSIKRSSLADLCVCKRKRRSAWVRDQLTPRNSLQ